MFSMKKMTRALAARRTSALARAARRGTTAAAGGPGVEPLEDRRFCDNNFAAAVVVGALEGRQARSGAVSVSADVNDYYKFTLPSAATKLNLKLAGGTGDADLILYDGSQSQLASSTGDTSNEVIERSSLPAGTYFARVTSFAGSTNYTLELTSDLAGNGTTSARNLGSVQPGTITAKDFVGTTDTNDYYKFTVPAAGNVTLKVEGLSANANLFLLNSGGTTIGSSQNGGTTAETLTKSLAPGTYFARVAPAAGASTNYSLKVTGPAPAAPDNAGNNQAAARQLGLVSGLKTYSDAINNADIDDFYKFYVGESGTITTQITGLSGNLNVSIEDSFGNELARSSAGGTTSDSVSAFAQPGYYYARVFQGTAGVSSNYTLNLTAPIDAGSTFATARTVTPTFFSSGRERVVIPGHVDGVDSDDVYKFQAFAGDLISIQAFDGVGLDLNLFNSSGKLVDSTSFHNNLGDFVSLNSVPASGDYYVEVIKGSPSTPTFYSLDINLFF
jgi:hypothetical protein